MECHLPISLACGKQMVPRSCLGPGDGLEEREQDVYPAVPCAPHGPLAQLCKARACMGPVSVDVSVCWEGEIPSFSKGKSLLGTKECQMGFGGMDLVVLGHCCAELLAEQLCEVAGMHSLA